MKFLLYQELPQCHVLCPTPLGPLHLAGNRVGVLSIGWDADKEAEPLTPQALIPSVLQQAQQELTAYFAGHLRDWTVPLMLPAGCTDFRHLVWQKVAGVPWGEQSSYGAICGSHKARAVGQAMAHNPWSIVVPCHRIVGGAHPYSYRWGSERKQWLLQHEQQGHHPLA